MFPLRWLRLTRGERGSATIEFAVSGVVLFTMMIGVMTMCQAIYTYHYVSEAAREGTRYAMVNGSSATTPATSSAIQTHVQNLGYPGIQSSLMTVTTTWKAYPSGTTCTPSSTCNNPGNLVTIKTSYAYPLSIPYLGSKTLTMTSTSAMVIAQ
jgi:Flp pilus assembly protein TadG